MKPAPPRSASNCALSSISRTKLNINVPHMPPSGVPKMNASNYKANKFDLKSDILSLGNTKTHKQIKSSFSVLKFNQKLTSLGSKASLSSIGSSLDLKAVRALNINGLNSKQSQSRIPTIPNSTSMRGVMSMMDFEGRIITIQIRSNWGDPEKIILPSIQVLDEKRAAIHIQNISTIPKLSDDALFGLKMKDVKLDSVVNYNLLKNSDETIAMKFPPEGSSETISIIIFADIDRKPKYCRIWNQKGSGDASIRTVNVLDGHNVIFAGDTPREFGLNFEFFDENEKQKNPDNPQSFDNQINKHNHFNTLNLLNLSTNDVNPINEHDGDPNADFGVFINESNEQQKSSSYPANPFSGINNQLTSLNAVNSQLEMAKKQKQIQSYKSSEVLMSLFPSLAKNKGVQDIYGKYPVLKTKKFRIEIYSTYTDDNFIGLNGIDIYDKKKCIIPYKDIDDIVLEGFTSYQDPKILFRGDKFTTEWEEMMLVTTDWSKRPSITISFNKPKIVTQFVIWNFNAMKRNLKFGIKQASLRAGSHLVWCGKVKKGTGSLVGMVQNTTNIHFVDVPSIREKAVYLEEE